MGRQSGQGLEPVQEAASQDNRADEAGIAARKTAQRQAGNVSEDERCDTARSGATAQDEPFNLLTRAAQQAQVAVQFEAEAFNHGADNMGRPVMQL